VSPAAPAAAPRQVPALAPARPLRLPRVSERVLANGLRVVAVRRPAVPLVHVRLRVPTATKRAADLARTELLAQSMLLGTDRRSEEDLADTLQAMGGGLRVGGDPDGFTLSGESLAFELPGLLDVLGEVLVGAAYPRRGVQRETARLAERCHQQLSQPASAAADAWAARRYGDHPYGRRIPRPDEVSAVSPGSLRAAHRRRLTPDGAVLVVVGDVAPARALDLVERHLDGWAATGRRDPVTPVPDLVPGPVLLVDRPGTVQANLRLGGDALGVHDPAYAAGRIADAIFTGLFSSRLVANLREDKGYTYGSYSVWRNQRAGSSLAIGVDVATEVAAPALVETIYELGRMVTLPPTADEVEAAVQYLTGTSLLGTATQSGLADTLVTLLERGLDVTWLRDQPAALAAVDPEQVLAAARTLLAPGGLVFTVLGDAERLHGPLSSVAAVTTLDGA
jgi:zinc protease